MYMLWHVDKVIYNKGLKSLQVGRMRESVALYLIVYDKQLDT